MRKRLEKLYEAIETSELTLEVLSPRIMPLTVRSSWRQRERTLRLSLSRGEWSCPTPRRLPGTLRTSGTS